MPSSDQGRYEPADVARLLALSIETCQAAVLDLPRWWNLTDGGWWLDQEQLEAWRQHFAPPPKVEIPWVQTRTLS